MFGVRENDYCKGGINLEDLSFRVGTFTIARKYIEQVPADVLAVMAKVIVVGLEYSYQQDAMKYTALSPEFEELEPNTEPPCYLVEINVDENDERTVSFVKREE